MKASLREERIKKALKQVLKKKGLQYKDVAQELNCSEPTVKRLFTAGELDLSRLLQLCQWLDISLGELEKMAELHLDRDSQKLTPQQEEYLAEHPYLLSFLSEMHDGLTPEKIAKKYDLNKRSLELYLIRLEKAGLLRSRGSKYEIVHKTFPEFNPDGPLVKQQVMNLVDQSSVFFKRRLKQSIYSPAALRKPVTCHLSLFRVPDWVFKEWKVKFEAQFKELDTLSDYYSKLSDPSSLHKVVISSFSVLMDPQDPDSQFSPISFGQIKNL